MAKKSGKNGNAKNKTSKKRNGKLDNNLISTIAATSIAATAFTLSIGLYWHQGNEAAIPIASNKTIDQKRDAFLKWITDNGGTFYPVDHGDNMVNVTLEEFPEFGGWGLALAMGTPKNQCETDFTNSTEPKQCQMDESDSLSSSGPIVKELDPLFTIPSTLIITIPHILDTYSTSSSPRYVSTFYPKLHSILQKGLKGSGLSRQINLMGLVEQDVILALYLMAENCQHEHARLFQGDSFYGPYLDVLPGLIPRLDTFDDDEYKVLGDEVLESMGRESKRALEYMFNGSTESGGEATLKAVLLDMIATQLKSRSSSILLAAECTSFESFHRFVALISSRAMVLRGVKRIVPLAEMINYAPLPDAPKNMIRPSFELFHTLEDDGSMTVRSDRDVQLPPKSSADLIKDDGSRVVQLFESYGSVDSSLFLEAHGFIPSDNPHHCAVLSGMLIEQVIAPNGFERTTKESIGHILQKLRLAPVNSNEATPLLQNVCIRKDMKLVEDGNMIGRRPASDAIAVLSLFGSIGDKILAEKCLQADQSNDVETIEISCARYPQSISVVRDILKQTATLIMSKTYHSQVAIDDGYTGHDEEIDKLIANLKDAETYERDQMAVAWRFRLEERRILSSIASSTDQATDDSFFLEVAVEFSLEEKVRDFNSFITSLQLPVNKLEARILDNGMRVGTFAKEPIEEDDIYISLPANTTIDYNNAIKDAPPDLKRLLQKYDKLMDVDGFMTLLIYLVHERFVKKDQSKWWPYLNLLPTIGEMQLTHPLFYEEQDIDQHLAGSDVRKLIIKYRQTTADKHAALSADQDAIFVLGKEIVYDQNIFLWASAIIDSRSIWWNKMRHLTPLLDLVNADSIGRPHETILESGSENVIVTRATRSVDVGMQLFENYAQPNYLLFSYHGFILEENPNDCALIQLSFDHNDHRAKNLHLLRSTLPSVCIKEDWISLDSLANLLRMKYDLPMKSYENGSGDRLRAYVIQELEQRVSRLRRFVHLGEESEKSASYHVRCMQALVRNDLMHIENALKLVTDSNTT